MKTMVILTFPKGECNVDQYTNYIKQVIIETVLATNDKEIIQLIYGILMNSNNPH